jgi:hypothetical protein
MIPLSDCPFLPPLVAISPCGCQLHVSPTPPTFAPNSQDVINPFGNTQDEANVGAIIGGIIGGAVGLLMIVGLVLFVRERRQRSREDMAAAQMGMEMTGTNTGIL